MPPGIGVQRAPGAFWQCFLGTELSFHRHLLRTTPQTPRDGVSLPLAVLWWSRAVWSDAAAASLTWPFQLKFKLIRIKYI